MKSKNILIVENKEQERKLFEYLIGQLYSYSSFGSAQEALKYITEQHVDLVLLSLHIPDLDPINWLQNVKKIRGKSCLVIAVTSNELAANAPFYHSQGFDEILSKPIRPKEVIFKIQHLFTKQEEEDLKNSDVTETFPILNNKIYQQLLHLSTREVLVQVYTDFIEECIHLNNMLNQVPVAQPSEEILRAIHTIKGNSGTLGAEKIYAAAKYSESAGRQQKSIEFAESLRYLKVAFEEFQEFLIKNPSLYGA